MEHKNMNRHSWTATGWDTGSKDPIQLFQNNIFKINKTSDRMATSENFVGRGGAFCEGKNVRKGESPFLVPFFNFYFFLYLVPFKTVLANEKDRYYLTKFKLHRIICGLAHVLVIASTLYLTINSVFQMIQSDSSTLLVNIFEFLSNLTALFLIVLMMHMLWRRETQFLEIINSTRVSYETIPLTQMKWYTRAVTILTFLITISLMIITFFLLTEQGHYISEHKNTTATTPSPKVDSQEMDNQSKNAQNSGNGEGFGTNVLTVATVVLFTYISAIFSLSHFMFPMISLALRQLGKQFETDLEQTFSRYPSEDMMEERIQMGIQLYRNLKGTTESIKNVFGSQLLAFCMTSVAYYAEAPHVFLGKRGNVEKAMLVYFIVTACVWFIAAEFHHHVKDVLFRWLELHTISCEINTSQRLKLLWIFNEATSDPVALQNKYFTATYGYLSSLLSLVASYVIIVFQLNQGDGTAIIVDPRPR